MAYILSQNDLAAEAMLSDSKEFEVEDDAKLAVTLLVKKRIENVVPLIRQQENQISEIWEVLVRLKNEVQATVTREDLERRLTDWCEVAQNKVAFDIQA